MFYYEDVNTRRRWIQIHCELCILENVASGRHEVNVDKIPILENKNDHRKVRVRPCILSFVLHGHFPNPFTICIGSWMRAELSGLS